MAVYGNMVLTQLGLALYSKAQTGVQLIFTRLQIGSGILPNGQDPTLLTALITPIAYFAINSITSSGNTSVVKGIFDNSAIAAPTYSCELGLFATDPTLGEILYAYANAKNQGDTIPPVSSGPLSKLYQINAAIGNAANVTATIPAGVYAPLDSPALSGIPTAPTPSAADNSTKLSTTAFVQAAVAAIPTPGAATPAARGTTRVTASPAAGDPIAPSRLAAASEVNLATTVETSIASYNPAAAGNFYIMVYFRIITGTTTVTVKVTYADVTGAQTTFIINTQVTAVGSYSLLPLFINVVAGTLIDVRVTASVANQVKASASIVGL